jgi:hypothetical protein
MSKPNNNEDQSNELIVSQLISVIKKNYQPTRSSADADVMMTTRELIKSLADIIHCDESMESKFVAALILEGFKIDTVEGDGKIRFYWVMKSI